MASGKLGAADLAAAADTLLYTVPANTVSTLNVRLVNRNATPVKVRIAIGAGAAPAAADYIEHDALIPANGTLENTALVMGPTEKLWVRSDVANVSARAHGFEE